MFSLFFPFIKYRLSGLSQLSRQYLKLADRVTQQIIDPSLWHALLVKL